VISVSLTSQSTTLKHVTAANRRKHSWEQCGKIDPLICHT